MSDVFLIPNVEISLNYICQYLVAGVKSSVVIERDTINLGPDMHVIVMPLVDTYAGDSLPGVGKGMKLGGCLDLLDTSCRCRQLFPKSPTSWHFFVVGIAWGGVPVSTSTRRPAPSGFFGMKIWLVDVGCTP